MTLPPARIDAVAALDACLARNASFSYLRLGDGELDFLLKVQDGNDAAIFRHPDRRSIEIAHCCPGMDPASAPRLLRAYEQADFVDLHTHLDFNRRHLPRLRWQPRPDQVRADGPAGAGLLQDWTIQKMPYFLYSHSGLFFGPEAGLLRDLLRDPEYHRASGGFWSSARPLHFLEPVGGGLDLSRHLEDFKAQIARAVAEHGCDTVFISLGGAAKILAAELATELKVRTIDFGSMIRMLTYSGSAGHASWRASYLPYLFRVPFPIYMKAVAARETDPANLLLKAQSQLCLDLQPMTPGASVLSDVIAPSHAAPSTEDIARFRASYAAYRSWRRRLAWRSPACLRLALAFEWWVLKKQVEPWGKLLARLRRFFKGAPCAN